MPRPDKPMRFKKMDPVVGAALRTVTPDGRPAPSRFSSARDLRAVYKVMKDDDLAEANRRARIMKVYNGYRPHNPETLKALGIKNITNINFLGLKGQIDARVGPLQDMALDTTNLVELRHQALHDNNPDIEYFGEVLAEEFSTTLRENDSFLPAVTTMVREADLYGLGPVAWTDYKDYTPVALERGQLKFLSDASAVSSKNELYIIESIMPAWYILGLLDDEEASRAAGWDLTVVKKYIIATFKDLLDTRTDSGDSMGTSVEESSVAAWRQNRVFDSEQFRPMHVLHAFVREVASPRGVTHYILPATEGFDGTTGTGGPDSTNGFLLTKMNAYDSMNQCLIWLPYNIGERHARSVRGLASYLLPVESVSNRLMGQIIDAGFRAASLMLTNNGAVNPKNFTINESGPYILIPNGLTPVTSPVAPQFQHLAALQESLKNVSFNNAMGARGPAAAPERVYSGADRKTKEQVLREASVGNNAAQSQFVIRMTVFDSLFRECFRRFINLVKDTKEHEHYPEVERFIERCTRRGVPREILRSANDIFSVYMCRELVSGGADAKAGILAGIIGEHGGNMDERGRLNATHDLILARMGKKSADRYRPTLNRDEMPSNASSHAVMENNDMRELAYVLAAPDQMHWSHIPIHGQLVEEVVNAAQSGQVEDPQRALDMLSLAAQHIQEHLKYGRTQVGMEPRAKQVEAGLRSLTPVVKQLTMQAAAIEKHRISQERQQETEMERLRQEAEGKDVEVKMHDIDTKAALKLREQDLNHSIKVKAAQDDARIKQDEAALKTKLAQIESTSKRYIEAGKIFGTPPPSPEDISGGPPLPGEEPPI